MKLCIFPNYLIINNSFTELCTGICCTNIKWESVCFAYSEFDSLSLPSLIRNSHFLDA